MIRRTTYTSDGYPISAQGPAGAAGRHCFYAVKTSQQTSFTNDVWTKITGWTEQEDTETAFASDTWTAPADGVIEVLANIAVRAVGDNATFAWGVAINGTVSSTCIFAEATHNGFSQTCSGSCRIEVSANDTIELHAIWTNQGSSSIVGAFGAGIWTNPTPDITAISTWKISFWAN